MRHYIPKSGRNAPKKAFYVFFCLNTAYEGKYARIEVSSRDKAFGLASELFGYQNIGSITPNEEYALNKIALLRLEEIK